MKARSDSFSGLARHEAMLGARAFWSLLGPKSTLSKILILVSVVVCLHVLASSVALEIGPYETGENGAAFLAAATRSGTLFVLPWTIASTTSSVTRLLYQRGDLDLLLASPVSARKLVAVRLLGMATEAVGSLGAAPAAVRRRQRAARAPALARPLSRAGRRRARGLWRRPRAGARLVLPGRAPPGARRLSIVATLVGASAVVAAQIIAVLPRAREARSFPAFPRRPAAPMGSADC